MLCMGGGGGVSVHRGEHVHVGAGTGVSVHGGERACRGVHGVSERGVTAQAAGLSGGDAACILPALWHWWYWKRANTKLICLSRN